MKTFEWVPLARSIHDFWNWMPNCFKAKSIHKPFANSLKDFFLRKLVATFSHRFFLFHQLPQWLDCLAPLTSQWPAIPLQQKSSLGANIKGETSAIQCNSRIITANHRFKQTRCPNVFLAVWPAQVLQRFAYICAAGVLWVEIWTVLWRLDVLPHVGWRSCNLAPGSAVCQSFDWHN